MSAGSDRAIAQFDCFAISSLRRHGRIVYVLAVGVCVVMWRVGFRGCGGRNTGGIYLLS